MPQKKTPREVVAAAALAVCGEKSGLIKVEQRKEINERCGKLKISPRSVGEHLAMLGYKQPDPAKQQPKIRKLIENAFKEASEITDHEGLGKCKETLRQDVAKVAQELGVPVPSWNHVREIARSSASSAWPNLGNAPRPVSPAQKMRKFAEIYNNFKMCPLSHDLIRVLFPGKQVKDPQRLLRRSVEQYRKFREEHKSEHLPELIIRANKDGRWIGVPPGVMEQLAEYRIDTKKVQRAKGVIVTAAQFGAVLNTEVWQSLKRYAAHRGYELVVLPIKYGPVMTVYQKETAERVLTSTFDEALKGHMLFEDLKLAGGALNLNVLRLRPTLDKFLTDRVCERGGNASQIYAAPKLELEHRPRLMHDYPKAIMTTGAVTHPDYNVDNLGQQDRAGELAAAEHTYAGILVEFSSKKTFHFRQLLASKEGEVFDIEPIHGGAVRVTPKSIEHDPDGVDAAYLGDWHTEKTHPDVREVTFGEMLPVLRPKNIILGDFFDGNSISHWDEKQASRRSYKAQARHDSVEDELNAGVREVEWMRGRMPGAKIHIIAANHNEFLREYIESMRWTKDAINVRVCAHLFAALQDDLAERGPEKFAISPMDPVNWWINKHAPFVVTHSRRSDLLLPESPDSKKILVTLHGDIGPRGQKAGSMRAFRKWNQWIIVGHDHSAAIEGPVWRVGTSGHLTEHYVSGPRTNWTHTHAIIFRNGQRQLLNIVNGAWHGQRKKRPKSAGIKPENVRTTSGKKKSDGRKRR